MAASETSLRATCSSRSSRSRSGAEYFWWNGLRSAALHPCLKFHLLSIIRKKQALSQTSVCVNTRLVDKDAKAGALEKLIDDEDDRRVGRSIIAASANVAGTSASHVETARKATAVTRALSNGNYSPPRLDADQPMPQPQLPAAGDPGGGDPDADGDADEPYSDEWLSGANHRPSIPPVFQPASSAEYHWPGLHCPIANDMIACGVASGDAATEARARANADAFMNDPSLRYLVIAKYD